VVSLAVVVPATAILIPFAMQAGGRVATYVRFKVKRTQYDRIVLLAEAGALDTTYVEDRYIVEPGVPVRIAFPSPGGFLDNWCGVVYDRTGYVMNVRAAEKFFGGDMISCRELQGPYYYCCFT
jgi:hypothetical protein